MLHDYRNSKELVSVELVQRIMLKRALEKVPSGYNEHPVYLDRVMAAEFKLKNRHENSSEALTIFSQVYYNYRGHLLKMKNCNSQLFKSHIKGEDSYDCGGPMRDIVSNMCEELMSDVLPILVPTANNVANVEPNADCFTLNPKAEQPFVLQKILFLGYLLGWSLY